MKYVVVYEKTETGYSAYAPDLAGCATTGATLDLTAKNMREAMLSHVRLMRSRGEPIPEPTAVATDQITIWEEPLVLKYQSGEEIRRGDRVLFHREPAEVEFVVNELTGDEGFDGYMFEYGGGVVIREANDPNTVFIDTESLPDTEDLEFVSRASATG